MDAYTCIVSKRDTRAYADKPIPPEALRRILQAGRMAGSAKNAQLSRFVVLEERGGSRSWPPAVSTPRTYRRRPSWWPLSCPRRAATSMPAAAPRT